MTTLLPSGDRELYIKMYPAYDPNAPRQGIQQGEWSGTAFALKNGYLVTNYHVVDGAKSIIAHGENDTSNGYNASVVATDKNNDLAILKITDSRFSGFGTIPYAIKNQMVDVGEDVWVLGYPLTQVLGNEIKLTNGVVSSRSGYQGDVSTYQISAPVQPGNSGGPLFDSKGNIVGIINAGVPGAENVGYAIKTSYLKNLADSFSLTANFPTSNSISSLALKDQVKRVRDFVFMLTCSSKAAPIVSSSSSSSRGSNQNQSSAGSVSSSPKPSTSNTGSSTQKPSTTTTSESSSKPIRQTDDSGVTITNLISAKALNSSLRITQVRIQDSQTIIDFECSNEKPEGGYDEYCSIEKTAHIIVDGKTYNLTKVSGIKVSPDKTYFSSQGEKLKFKLFMVS